MEGVRLKLDERQWHHLQEELGEIPANVPKAAAAALNRTAATAATRIRRRLAGVLGMGVRTLGNQVKALKTDKEELTAKVRLYNFNFPLAKTKLKPSGPGPYLLSKEQEDPTPVQHAPFQVKLAQGHLGWFVRYGQKRLMTKGRYGPEGKGKTWKKKQPMREPIVELFAPAPRKVWEDTPNLAQEELSALGAVLDKNLDSQIARFLVPRDSQSPGS